VKGGVGGWGGSALLILRTI